MPGILRYPVETMQITMAKKISMMFFNVSFLELSETIILLDQMILKDQLFFLK